ncbi:PepSY domain-containing protein [Sinorhizobium sp. BG8]|uniref:PepSY-associated TM helix domain-containing protein n=1 Tax=Sinorhizobium sp. BG8 TaxID=2613773 RepID=UPI00193E8C95|nr:PepSY domain-containing protein [Sinorhizobium sp. BG8]QRM54643.1 PepSY domain-containing protein [Sinorhizobium sp. BG8]
MSVISDAPALAVADTSALSQRLYRAIWRWHFFAGLLVVPFLVSLSITGALYLFNDEIDASLFRDRNYVTVSDSRMAPSEIVERALAAVPGSTFSSYRTPAGQDRSARVTVGTEAGNVLVFVNPSDGAVLDKVGAKEEFNEVVKDLHSLDYFGDSWEVIIEIVAGFTIVLVLTGIYLWWPRKQSGGVVTVRGTPSRRVFWRDLHAVTGFAAGGLILFLAATGLLWSGFWGSGVNAYLTANGMGYPAELWDDVPASTLVTTDVLPKANWLMENAPVPESSAATAPAAPIGLDRAVAITDAAGMLPGYEMSPPSGETGVYTAAIFPAELSRERTLHIDQYSGKVLVDVAFGQYPLTGKAIEWGINLHQGREWGLFSQLLMLATCLAIVLSSVTAVVMWWKRRPSGRIGVPPAPRDKRIYIGLWLIAGVFGLAFPLTGFAILAMIAFDQLVVRFVPPLRRALS